MKAMKIDSPFTAAERFSAYCERMEKKGYRQIRFFVHDDDREKLRRSVNRMNEKRKVE